MIGNEQISRTISAIDKNSEIPFLRVAVSNYVWTTNGELLGILSKTISSSGVHTVGLIGGGAYLIGNEEERLKTLGAFDFEGKDARFKIPLEKKSEFIDNNGDPKFWCEVDISREIKEELSSELVGELINPILIEEETNDLLYSYLGCFNMVEVDSLGTIQRGTNFRINHLFTIQAPEDIITKIKHSPVIYPITRSDMINGYIGSEKIQIKPSIKKALEYTDMLGENTIR